MTSADRTKTLAAAESALRLARLGQNPPPRKLDALDRIVLHWATGHTMLDAVEAGYRVRWEDNPPTSNGYAVRDQDNRLVAHGFGVQADAWRAAIKHMGPPA